MGHGDTIGDYIGTTIGIHSPFPDQTVIVNRSALAREAQHHPEKSRTRRKLRTSNLRVWVQGLCFRV